MNKLLRLSQQTNEYQSNVVKTQYEQALEFIRSFNLEEVNGLFEQAFLEISNTFIDHNDLIQRYENIITKSDIRKYLRILIKVASSIPQFITEENLKTLQNFASNLYKANNDFKDKLIEFESKENEDFELDDDTIDFIYSQNPYHLVDEIFDLMKKLNNISSTNEFVEASNNLINTAQSGIQPFFDGLSTDSNDTATWTQISKFSSNLNTIFTRMELNSDWITEDLFNNLQNLLSQLDDYLKSKSDIATLLSKKFGFDYYLRKWNLNMENYIDSKSRRRPYKSTQAEP